MFSHCHENDALKLNLKSIHRFDGAPGRT
ncbi:hypothetical protein D029_0918A, partial [Vibrio parahaemolyticus 970107]